MTAHRTGERWKAFRLAAGKQILPKNVKIYHSDFTQIVDRCKEYIKCTRNEDGIIEDIVPILKRLVVECKFDPVIYTVLNPTAPWRLMY